jgi:hypothetical protein
VEQDSRTYKPWSHVVALVYVQLTHILGLNDFCDALGLHSGPLSAMRGTTSPKRNTLSHANRERDPAMAGWVCWQFTVKIQPFRPHGLGRLNAQARGRLGNGFFASHFYGTPF